MVEITEIRHEHQSKFPLPDNICIPYVAFFRVPEWCLGPRDRLRGQNMSVLSIFFRKLSLHQSKNLMTDQIFFFKKINNILVHFICGPEKKL